MGKEKPGGREREEESGEKIYASKKKKKCFEDKPSFRYRFSIFSPFILFFIFPASSIYGSI